MKRKCGRKKTSIGGGSEGGRIDEVDHLLLRWVRRVDVSLRGMERLELAVFVLVVLLLILLEG